jgi:hypothetical protein
MLEPASSLLRIVWDGFVDMYMKVGFQEHIHSFLIRKRNGGM